MDEIKVTYEQSIIDYPNLMKKMIDELLISEENVKLANVNFYYYWTIIPEGDSDLEEIKHLLKFEERFEYEKSKIAIEIYIKHKNYIRGEIVDHLPIPNIVLQRAHDAVVAAMIYEQYIFRNESIIQSIPEEVDFEKIFGESIELSLDSILDKISTDGYESLSDLEINFLRKYNQ